MANYDDRLNDYVDVAERIRIFRERFPEGSLQPVNPADPFSTITIGDRTFVVYVAAAYRTPDDPRPGIGAAWELFPGRTPYTKDSELMVAETSAWGRAIVAVLAADSKKVASRNEVIARAGDLTSEEWETNANRKTPPDAPQGRQTGETARPRGMATDKQERALYAISKALGVLPPAKGTLTFEEASNRIEELKAAQLAGNDQEDSF